MNIRTFSYESSFNLWTALLTRIAFGAEPVCICLAMSRDVPHTPHLALDPPTILDKTGPKWTPYKDEKYILQYSFCKHFPKNFKIDFSAFLKGKLSCVLIEDIIPAFILILLSKHKLCTCNKKFVIWLRCLLSSVAWFPLKLKGSYETNFKCILFHAIKFLTHEYILDIHKPLLIKWSFNV